MNVGSDQNMVLFVVLSDRMYRRLSTCTTSRSSHPGLGIYLCGLFNGFVVDNCYILFCPF